jgi:signal transduction histidine kinase
VETIREMRARRPDAAIVAFSGFDGARARAAAFDEGAQDFISKNGPEAGSLDRSILFALERWRAVKLHRQFADLLEANPDAMIVSGPGGAIRFANAAACALFDRSAADFIGDRLPFELHEGQVSEIEVARGNGRRAAEMRVVKCMWDGEQALLANIRDITEQRAFAEQLRNAQKLEAIGRFAGGLAHDFGNLLSCIEVFAGLAAFQARPKRLEPLDRIKAAVENGRAIVRQLLSLERGRSGVPERVDLGELLSALDAFLRRTLPPNIELGVECPAGLWPVMIDQGQIEQVILNLALNARDAMPAGGRLRIECANQPAASSAADRVIMRVTDTGCGIAAEHLPQVFEFFFTTKAPGLGTGLGLAMCRAIVEQAGGSISVDSRPGEGACFTVSLPRAG